MAKPGIPKKAIKKPLIPIFNLQHLVSDLAEIERHHYRLSTDERENDIEHSFSVAMMSWYVVSAYDLPLDIELVLKYSLAHDFVERYAGDMNTFASPQERKDKVLREQSAFQQLSEEFSAFPDMVHIMQGYESKSDPEALFVWTIDKIQALILGDMDNWRPYQELEINFSSFRKKFEDLLSNASPYCKEIFEEVIKYCHSTYYDQPITSQQG